jgi:type 1 fimbria pilin
LKLLPKLESFSIDHVLPALRNSSSRMTKELVRRIPPEWVRLDKSDVFSHGGGRFSSASDPRGQLDKGVAVKKCILLAGLGWLLASLLYPAKATASCSGPMFTQTVRFPATLTAKSTVSGPVLLMRVGSVGQSTFQCTDPPAYGIKNVIVPDRGLNGYFPTNVPNLSYRVAYLYPSAYYQSYPNMRLQGTTDNRYGVLGRTIELVQMGPIPPGSVLRSGTLGYLVADNLNVQAFILAAPVTIISTPACTPNTKSVTVALDPIKSGQLTAIGSVAAPKRFELTLNCTAPTAVSVQLDYNGTPSNIPGVLSSTGSAKGVGVQVLDRNMKPVPFGAKLAQGTSSNGLMSIPFVGQYYRTGTVTPGTLYATAGFTFSYP